MITLRAEITKTSDGRIKYRYLWILQSKHNFKIRIIRSLKNYISLKRRYSRWMIKTVLNPELISRSRTGEEVIILETEFS